MSDPILLPEHSGESTKPALTPASGRKHRHWIWMLIVFVVILGIAGIFIFRHHSQSETSSTSRRGGSASAIIVVNSATAQQGDIGIYVNALGVVTPLNTVSVNSRVQGQIVKVNYQEGQMVRAGD